ncbi:HpcH/HpaI aldolase/citrate lyase family protein [Roseobacter sp. OBYS 0001]|uniref:HpcH/HpaI aldolase family protein n=1 Tax=Roseobacter sp. OBYS 0001 TaxID=882651 RepID=UPI001BBFDBBE|nr:HpcH/HpaI aldolase/citrate lyase family protein [Roseobacter sp. OBYS 0001]GIT86424.1 2-keto-3-deoxy-L-rhamnonate aldolase [Roseobacter sp. OBYS 0001]
MSAPLNTFKISLSEGETLFGCWMSMAEGYTAEILGNAGFDWLLIDGEHSPNDVRSIRDQMIALKSSDSHPIIRVPVGETWIIKQMLDLGAQTILVPMVETAEQAQELVRACRYPPEGRRGVGYAVGRASGFGQIENYGPTADAQTCLLVQVENKTGLDNLDAILAVDGVDGVFIGPADLSASLGYLGQTMHPDMQATILKTIKRISDSGKAAGILTTDDGMIKASLDAGARFVAVAMDIAMLLNTGKSIAAKWKQG